MPLVLAWLTQYGSNRSKMGERAETALGWLPVPLMALVLLVVFAAVAPEIGAAAGEVARAVPIYVAFAALMPFVGRAVSRFFRLESGAARALAFNASTRNSLVVLPLAFAASGGDALIPAAVVTQTVIELLGKLVYVRWIPRLIRPAAGGVHQHGAPAER